MPRLDHPDFRPVGGEILFEYEGEAIPAIEGETIAAALAVTGKRLYGRDRAGNPRGMLCGMGVCQDCRVVIDQTLSERACMIKVRAGMKVRAEDYLVQTGPALDAGVKPHDPQINTPDVLIIGAGPAGLAAAEKLAREGVHAVVLDERPEPGGQFFKQLASSMEFSRNIPSDDQYVSGAERIARAVNTGAQIVPNAIVWGAFKTASGGPELAVTIDDKTSIWRPRQLILATGAYEHAPPFPGWTLPGVMMTGAAQGLARAYRVSPGQRVLIAGNGPLNLQLACELAKGGISVVAVVEAATVLSLRRWPAAIMAILNGPRLLWRGFKYLRTLHKLGIPVLYGHHILTAGGTNHVEHATVAAIDSNGDTLADSERTFEVDTLCLGYGFKPSTEIALTLGCDQENIASGCAVPIRDSSGQTSISGVFVAGDSGGLGGAQAALVEGQIAAAGVLANLMEHESIVEPALGRALRRHRRFQKALWSLYRAPHAGALFADPETIICRCEGVTFGTINTLLNQGVRDLGTLKRISRAGMGRCQGRYCQHVIAQMIGGVLSSTSGNESRFTPQNPVKPITIKSLASEIQVPRGYMPVSTPKPRAGASSNEHIIGETDTLVIGAGVIGVCTAYFMTNLGIETLIVDRGAINGEASGGNAGSLHLQLLTFDTDGGADIANWPSASALSLQRRGVELWKQIDREQDGDLELKICGGIMLAESKADLVFLRRKVEVERRYGIDTEILSEAAVRKILPDVSNSIIGGAFCPEEGKLNPLLATPAIAAAACSAGAEILASHTVTGIEFRHRGFAVATDRGIIKCKHLVNACGGWSSRIAGMAGISLPVHSAPQQMIVTEAIAPAFSCLVSHATRRLTLKQVANGNIIIGGGWPAGFDVDTGRTVALRDRIEGNLWAARHVFPVLGDVKVIRTWAAVGVVIDGAPILGEVPGVPGFYNAVGANGYTMAPAIGQIIAESIKIGRSTTDIEAFSIERFST